MSTALPTTAARNPWIVSPIWDMAYLVATPLVIVPVVLLLAQHVFTPEQITVVVVAFASMGHHLPGFMRAYGDRELFARFQLRFLLMPVLIFALALAFSPPSWIRQPLGLSWHHLHGLELIILLWGTWHGLMQTYGFMRIYDLKRGIRDVWTARLDHWLCLALFGCGFLFSDARMYGTAEVMWQIGLPVFDRSVLQMIRVVAGILAAGVAIAYMVHTVRQSRISDGVSANKLLLAATTGWIYWYTGRISTNLIIGLAMFEIYHAVQYYAIVWHYNRQIVKRTGKSFGWLSFLFRDGWTMLGLYLALIAAFGSIRYFTVDTADYVFRGTELDAHKLLIVFLVTSTFLHYYFDGFIWKVSEPKTQCNLFGKTGNDASPRYGVPALLHAAKCALFFAIAIGLLWLEQRPKRSASSDERIIANLAALTPDLPELQIQVSRDALEHGNVKLAIEAARKALALRPRSHSAHADLAVALMENGQYDEAGALLKQAIEIEPRQWRYHTNLGLSEAELKNADAAKAAFQRAVEIAPDEPAPHRRLADWLLEHDQPRAAARHYQLATRAGGSRQDLALRRIEALLAAGEFDRAAIELAILRRKLPSSVPVTVAAGRLAVAQGRLDDAIISFQRAVEQVPHAVDTWFMLGTAHYAAQDLPAAAKAFGQVLSRQPNHAAARANMGAVQIALKRPEAAEKHLRHALAIEPNLGEARINLAAALLAQGWRDAARAQLHRARQLGYEIPESLQQQVDATE